MNRKLMTLLVGIGLSASLAALPAHAQQAPGGDQGNAGQGGGPGGGPGGPGGQGRGRFGGGRPNFQQMMQRRMDNIKQALGATDDEWAALQPKIEAIQQAQFQSRMGGMMRGGRFRGGPGGPGGNNPMANNPVATAMTDLRSTLDNKDATPDQIKSKLQAVRDARQKSEADLKQKQDDLKQLLTVRQEAVLVTEGILD